MKDTKLILVLVKVEGNVSKAAEKEGIQSKSATDAYRCNYDATFGKKETSELN